MCVRGVGMGECGWVCVSVCVYVCVLRFIPVYCITGKFGD